MFEIGNTLREARAQQGLTLRDAEYATKIRSKYLQALEQDDFEVIPGPTYVKAFLRTYAIYLGLDDNLLIQEYVSRFEPEAKPPIAATPRALPRSRPGPPRRRSSQLVVGIVAAVIILILGWIGLGNRGEKPAALDVGTLQTASTTVPPTVPTTTSVPGTSSTTSSSTPGTSGTGTTIAPGMAAIRVKAVDGSCRLTLREMSEGGKTLVSGTLDEGESKTFATASRYWLKVTTPTRLNLVVNGRTLEVPPVEGVFLVNPSGLERLQ